MRDMLETFAPARQPRFLTGRHVLIALIAFFGTVFGVNGYFLFAALSTHTGVVAVEPYRKGLAYNTRIAADQRQAALGWNDIAILMPDGAFAVTISDRDGAPVNGLSVAAVLSRPSTASADVVVQLEEIGSGRYAANTGPRAPGTWIAMIEARRTGDEAEPLYRARRRLWLKP